MTPEQIIQALDAIPGGRGADAEANHSEADRLLLAAVPEEVGEAYRAVVARQPWWACA